MALIRLPDIPRFVGSWAGLREPNVMAMSIQQTQVQHCAAGEGRELTAPDAVHTVKIDCGHTGGQFELFEVVAPRGPSTPLHRTNWEKAYYVLHGRMIVQVENEGYDLGPGSSVTIPANARHTFTVLSPAVTFLAIGSTGAMGRFLADLDESLPRDRPLEQSAAELRQVLSRHDVKVLDLDGRVP